MYAAVSTELLVFQVFFAGSGVGFSRRVYKTDYKTEQCVIGADWRLK